MTRIANVVAYSGEESKNDASYDLRFCEYVKTVACLFREACRKGGFVFLVALLGAHYGVKYLLQHFFP